jgi:hypothetical protein
VGELSLATDPVQRALARLDESPAARRAGEALDTILHGVRSSCWPAVAWRFSVLTASGCPVEFSFSSGDRVLRYTAEIAGPETAAAARLDLGAALLEGLTGGAGLPSGLHDTLLGVQASAPLAWGAWIGARHDERGSRYKLYAEVPRDAGRAAETLTERLHDGRQPLAHRKPRLEGIGYQAGADLLELYYRLAGLDVADTGSLLTGCGFGHQQRALLDLMQLVYARAVRPDLPRQPYGLSITLAGGRRPAAVTIFSYAVDVFGADARARARLLALGPALGWGMDAYRQISEPVADVEQAPTHHTVVAFTVAAQGPAVLTIGLVPP